MDKHGRVAEVLVDFIKANYSNMVVEVGCGRFSAVAVALRPFFKVTSTDLLEIDAVDCRLAPIYVKDDITSPVLRVYQGASLLFSSRPPLEIQSNILALSELIGADALIKPFGSEIIDDVRLTLLSFRGLPLYLFRNERRKTR
ncbi:MAG: UPF0146 family protein [Halobacteriota archaeon]